MEKLITSGEFAQARFSDLKDILRCHLDFEISGGVGGYTGKERRMQIESKIREANWGGIVSAE